MKKIVAILLNVVFSTSVLFSAFVVGDYFVRYDYYSNVLCENQEEPELQCNGKCHLSLNEQGDESKKQLPELEEFHVEAIHADDSNSFSVKLPVLFKVLPNYNQHLVPLEFLNRLLRPPQFIVQGLLPTN
jgi:hypothetical protein